MKNLKSLWLVLSILSMGLTACDDDKDNTVSVSFDALAADGSATVTTTLLTLGFDQDIEGLAATDITLTAGQTGAVKGALTSKGSGVYELAVSGITAGGEVTVAVAKSGYSISPASRTVNVFYAPPATEVAFTDLMGNGSATVTTNALFLIFDRDVDGLSADDITLTAGETGAVKGILSHQSIGTYHLAVSGITAGGEVTVAVAKNGYNISPASRTLNVFYAPPAIEVAFTGLTGNGSETATTTALTLTFDRDVDGLSADDITLTASQTGASKGTLTSKGNGEYELELTNVIADGEAAVTVVKEGYTFTPDTETVEIIRTDKYLKITDIPNNIFNKEIVIIITIENTLQGGDNVVGCIENFQVMFNDPTFEGMLTGLNHFWPFTQSGTYYIQLFSDGSPLAAFEADFDTNLIEVSWYGMLK